MSTILDSPVYMRGAGIYNENSQFQRCALDPVFKLLPVAFFQTGSNVTIADYGSSEGSNSVAFHQELLACLSYSTATIIFNDTCFNDFNSLCSTISSSSLMAGNLDGPQVLPLMAPGSYYKQVVPAGLIDLGVSITSLNWLPCLQVIRATPLMESELCDVAMKDLACFLQQRHMELRPGGTLLLCFPIDGDLDFDAPIGAIKDTIHDIAGLVAANAYQAPVYLRKRVDVDTVLRDLAANWQVIDIFEKDIEHPASARIRSMMSGTCCEFDQDFMASSTKAMCDFALAIATNSIIGTIRFFEKRAAQNFDNTEAQHETDEQLLKRVNEALFEHLLHIDWTRPIGSRYVYIKLQRT